MTDQRGLGFIDAVKELAQTAGIEMPAPDPRAQEKAEREKSLHDVTEAAARFFASELAGAGGAAARAYVKRRGLSDATVAAFAIGFAPDSRTRLRLALEPEFGVPKLVETGMLIQPDEAGKEAYDRFRGRLMIPIRDPRGRVIAFGGRILDSGEPKYLNSPDTPLFDKGRTLFNLDRAAGPARKANRIIVVEGYMDVIALAQAGIEEAVAPLGTALTEGQLERLWRVHDAPLLCFDGDSAGQRAAVRAAVRALPILRLGRSLNFAVLPPGQDPDDVIKKVGARGFEAVLQYRSPLVQVVYESERRQIDGDSPDARAGLRQRLDSLAESCADKLVVTEYRRSFTSLFFEDFGWKGKDRRTVSRCSLRTSPRERRELSTLYIRSLLYGLSRFPFVTSSNAEAVAELHIDHDIFRRWRDTLVNVAVTQPTLEDDAITAILEAEALPDAKRFDLQYDLRFPHMRSGLAPAIAADRLVALIDMLRQEREIDDELARLNAKAIADTGLGRYEAIEIARQRLREQKRALQDWGATIGAEAEVISLSDHRAARLDGSN